MVNDCINNKKGKETQYKISLSDDVIKKLQEIAQRRGISMTEAIKIAINTEDYIQTQIEKGGKILVEKPDNTLREVIFK